MSEIAFIVDKLNSKPLERGLTLVSFDELSAFELLEELNHVLVYLDAHQHKVDLREESQTAGATGTRIFDFLRILKYKPPGGASVETFKEALGRGERSAAYPVLHFLLSRLEPMRTRAYLARFLVRVDVPAAFLHDDAIQEVFQHYKGLQQEFKEAHKLLESLRHNTMQPGELKREIKQLEEEKGQLLEKISQLERKTQDTPGFTALYKATSALRREQEEEAKLQEQGREQHAAFEVSEQRLGEVRVRFEQLSAAQRDDSPQELLGRLDGEVRDNRATLEDALPRDVHAWYERLSKVERGLSEPLRSQTDVDEVDDSLRRAQRDVESLQEQVDRARRLSGGEDKLKMFRSQSALMAKKLQQKQEELDAARLEARNLDAETASKERQLATAGAASARSGAGAPAGGARGGSGAGMSKSEFARYANGLRAKTAEFKKKKAELEALRAETVVLSRTESIMRARGDNVEEFLKSVERGQGVEGAGDVEIALEDVSKKAADLNKDKKMTLEEISEIIRRLKDTLATRKVQLAPQIASLRSVREKFKELETEYLDKKAVYENTAAGLQSERIRLENECNAGQKECIREESRFHYLNCLTDVADVQLGRVQDELAFQKGEGRLLRDFASYKELYQHKIQQQEQLSKELRKKQKALKENATDNSHQRQQFVDLKRILMCKHQLMKVNENKDPNGTADGVLDLGHQVGGANVMTIEQAF